MTDGSIAPAAPLVLVIDDDVFIRELLKLKFTKAGFDVETAEDGEAGVAAALARPPDIVLVDWMMPRLSGPEVCKRLRDAPQTARVPMILLTAKAQEADMHEGFAAGADDYALKPFSPRELVARVNAALGRVDA
jgi:two-component system phosphate regulon response regulator PhoB